METAIGVFASRDKAEEAFRELRQAGLPEESINFLTRSETEAKTIAKEFGSYVGGFMGGAAGMSAGVVAATLLLPGIGPVFALGFGAAAVLGLAGAGAGRAVGTAAAHDPEAPIPTLPEKCSEEATFLREVLKEGRSLIVVQTESRERADLACGILDRLGLGMQGATPARMQAHARQSRDITILDISGRITVGEGNVALREIVRELAGKGQKRILLNLAEVTYVDSSGIGELVKTHTTLRNQNGHLKLVNPSKRVSDLLQMTRLATVFDIYKDEASAIDSFGSQPSPKSVA